MKTAGMRAQSRHGFSLAELVIWLALFSLAASMVLSTLVMAVRLWSESMDRVRVQQNVRLSMDSISSEVREGCADGDTGSGGNAPTGYMSISPAVSSTAILSPNANIQSTHDLIVTVPSATLYDPSQNGWVATTPSNFQRIRYYMTGGALHREQITWSSLGSVTDTVDDVLASPSAGGTLLLTTQYLSPTSVLVTLVSHEGSASFGLTQTLQVIVR